MPSPKRKLVALSPSPAERLGTPPITGAVLGRVTGIAASGRPLVDFPGNTAGPRVARTVLRDADASPIGRAVLLVFENADPRRPIIVGLADDLAVQTSSTAVARDERVVTGKRITLEAQQELVLRAGSGSLTIRADGTIVLRGTDVLTRSSGANRIKGATVKIN